MSQVLLRVFLDFDGVLRRQDDPCDKLEVECVERLESCVLPHPHVRVVVTSTWRLAMPAKKLHALFSPAFAERIEGMTPDRSVEDDDHCRHAEVLQYLREKDAALAPWIALDDQEENYGQGAPLILMDPAVAFDEYAARRLESWIAKHTPAGDANLGDLDFTS